MTIYELQKAQELKENIEAMKESVRFFSPETNGRFNGWSGLSETAKESLKLKFPFNFKLFKKTDKTAECDFQIKGFLGGSRLEVDKDFVEHCRKYFEKRLEQAEAEFEKFSTKE